jgi:hypothetical protein
MKRTIRQVRNQATLPNFPQSRLECEASEPSPKGGECPTQGRHTPDSFGSDHNKLLVGKHTKGEPTSGEDTPRPVRAIPTLPGLAKQGRDEGSRSAHPWYEERRVLKCAWVDYIKELGDRIGGWEWFSTYTFRYQTHPESAHKAWMKLMHRANRRAYGVRYTNRPGDGISSIVAMEYQKRGVLHFHTLDGATKGIKRMQVVDEWFSMAGIARVYPFRKHGGAEAYVSKYIMKADPWREHNRGGDIFLAGPFGSNTGRLEQSTIVT